jgi:hypothetical protein
MHILFTFMWVNTFIFDGYYFKNDTLYKETVAWNIYFSQQKFYFQKKSLGLHMEYFMMSSWAKIKID